MIQPPLQVEERTFWNRLRSRLRAEVRRRAGVQAATPGPPMGAGLVGVGNVARWLYLPRLRARSCPFQLRAVYDVDAAAAERVAASCGARVCAGLAELLAQDIAAVFVCTPVRFHLEAVLAAASAGKHVLCEKPLGGSGQEARAMCEAAERAGIVHMVNFSFRFRPDLVLAGRLLQAGVLGRLYHLWGTLSQSQWFTEQGRPATARPDAAAWKFGPGGGVVLDLGPHLLDLCRGWLGEIREVRAWTKSFRRDVAECEDACGFSLTCAEGAMAHLLASRWATGTKERTALEISGSLGTLRLDQGMLRLWTVDQPRWRDLLVPREAGDFLAAFHNAIRGAPGPIPNFRDGLKNNEALDAIILSGRSGRAVSLNGEVLPDRPSAGIAEDAKQSPA